MADYAISNVPRRVVYAASGTGPYAFTFEILAASDIAVYKGDALLTLTTDYTVTINANGTGSVTLTTSAGTSNITIVGSKTIQRTTDFTTGGDFFANTLNDELDAQTIFIQQVGETAERGLKAPVTDPTDINMVLPRKASRAGKTLAFDSNGNPVVGEDIGNWRGDWAAGTAYTVRDLVRDASNLNVYRCNTAHTSSGVAPISGNADSAKWDVVIAVADLSDLADAADASADAAAASAILANDWATKTSGPVAGGEYSAKKHAQDAATSAGTSTTKAGEASASASSASASASTATTKASEASASAASAATAKTAAETAKAGAETAQTAAVAAKTAAESAKTSAETAATAASGSASTATTKAGEAASSASSAASSAATATAKAGEAASSASTAVRYIGPATANPTTRNDSSPLQAGDLYFNTVAVEMRVYNGSAWQAQAASPDTLVERSFLATAGQTSYTFTGGYRVGYTYVYVNGALLYGSDITATDGTTITFASALSLNDEVRILSLKAVGTIAIADISGLQTALDGKQAYDANNAVTNAVQSFTKAQRGAVSALTDGATITPDFSLSNNYSVTLGGNRTLANPTNLVAGQSGVITITQDGTGSRTLAYGSYFKFPGGTAPTLTTTASAVDVLAYYVESSTRITARLVADVK